MVVLGYGMPTVQSGSTPAVDVIDGTWLITMVRILVPLAPAASSTVIVTEYEPIVVGVPEITPVPAAIVKPGGRPLAAHVLVPVPLLEVNVVVYARVRVPSGSEFWLTVGAALMV